MLVRLPRAVLFVLLLPLIAGCGRKDYFRATYPAISLRLMIHHTFRVHENYDVTSRGISMNRLVDSTGIQVIHKGAGRTMDQVEQPKGPMLSDEAITQQADHINGNIEQVNGEQPATNAGFMAHHQDTTVAYGLSNCRSTEFRERYLPSALIPSLANAQCSQVEKDGKKLVRFTVDHRNGTSDVLYAGMVKNYWFVIWFFTSNKQQETEFHDMWSKSVFE